MTTHCSSRRALPSGVSSGLRLAAGSAISLALAACGFSSEAFAHNSDFNRKIEERLAKGQFDKAIAEGEKGVAKEPRDASLRAALGWAYVKAGRFESAATALGDALELGDTSSRTALSLALADIALGRNREAIGRLEPLRDTLPASDYGLALALAGETGRGVAVLTDALRMGDSSSKLRQNLAYALALDGRWADARLMAIFDLPGNQVDNRLTQWASSARPDAYRERVAGLLGVPLRSDAGMPQSLALAKAVQPQPVLARRDTDGELPAVSEVPATGETTTVQASALQAVPAPAKVSEAAPVSASKALPASGPAPAPVKETALAGPMADAEGRAPVFTPIAPEGQPTRLAPVHAAAVHAAPARMAMADRFVPIPARAHPVDMVHATARPARHLAERHRIASGTHMVQLGSFSSEQNAERAKRHFAEDAGLRGHAFVITKANVNGRYFWRVAAGGYDMASANNVCGSRKRHGEGCLAYAADRAPRGEELAMASPREELSGIRPDLRNAR